MFPIYGQFIDIQFELGTFKLYMDILEKQLPEIERMESERMFADLREKGWQDDPDEINRIHQELHDVTENVIPRFFRSTLLVSLWAIYESAIREIASYLKAQKKLKIGIGKIRGNLLERAKLYFEHILNFDLHSPQAWRALETFYLLRNAIAHGNGRLDAIKDDGDRKKIIQLLEQANSGISTYYDNILISKDYLRETYSIVDDSLTDLIKRTSLEYPPPDQRTLRPV